MVYPVNGRYSGDVNDEVCLGEGFSPSSSGTAQAFKAADIGAGVVGLLSGVGLVAASFTPLAVVTVPAMVGGVASGVYSASRSGYALLDRSTHEEVLSNISTKNSFGFILFNLF